MIWLGRGVPCDETDGHVDNLACFVRPGTVLLSVCEDPADPMHEVGEDALARLRAARDAAGRELEVLTVPAPGPLHIQRGRGGRASRRARAPTRGAPATGSRPPTSTSIPPNSRIVFPLLDERFDERAAEVLAACFPEREVVGVPAREILLGGGNVHCITQQVPADAR